jgi:hypothetical protein
VLTKLPDCLGQGIRGDQGRRPNRDVLIPNSIGLLDTEHRGIQRPQAGLCYSEKIAALSGQSHLPRSAIKQAESELAFQLPY